MVYFVPMVERLPFLDVLIAREHGDTWRKYFGPASWCPPSLRARLDEYREIFPVSRPDADDLVRFMGNARAHYQHHRVKDGGVEILAKGRSALTLAPWLEYLVRSASARPIEPAYDSGDEHESASSPMP